MCIRDRPRTWCSTPGSGATPRVPRPRWTACSPPRPSRPQTPRPLPPRRRRTRHRHRHRRTRPRAGAGHGRGGRSAGGPLPVRAARGRHGVDLVDQHDRPAADRRIGQGPARRVHCIPVVTSEAVMWHAGRVAVLGGGVMGEALVVAVLRSGLAADAVIVAEKAGARAQALAATHGVRTTAAAAEAVAGADVVVVAVKPQDVAGVLAEIGPALADGALVVTVAAGLPLAFYEARLPAGTPVVRVMPNTPAVIGAGAGAMSTGSGTDHGRGVG